jgi:tRNA/tmRNA/rRNA uracil-C5-methylase (TrmA/RlmC/RlmD family)
VPSRSSGAGRLLDLACGTGQLSFALRRRFAEVWAADQEPDMISVVRAKAQAAGSGNIRTVISAAEDLAAPGSRRDMPGLESSGPTWKSCAILDSSQPDRMSFTSATNGLPRR